MSESAKKVMLVDDDPLFLDENRAMFEVHGYKVSVAYNGVECLTMARSEQPDAIVLDAAMPFLSDGFRVSRELRESELTKHIPQLMVTCINERLGENFGRDDMWLPVDRFIEKPIGPRQLLDEVEKLLNESGEDTDGGPDPMNGKAPRILVVDDEPGMRAGCHRILAAEGYEVETAEDGIDALERFVKENGSFSVALVDLKMPRMDGLELIDRVHEMDEDIVLLVITAYATIETAVEATKRGAYGYIPKPFTPDELLLPVKNGLEKRALSIEARLLREERERRLLEVAFERSKSNTIINCMTDGVLVVNRDRQIVLRNAAAARMIPKCAEIQLLDHLDSLESVQLRSLIEEALSSDGGPVICSKEISYEKSTCMVNAGPVLEPNGETLGAVAVLRDITALKKLETAKSLFVSMVAHEVKSPLAAIESYLNIILDGVGGEDPKRDRRMLERLLVRARALRMMVSELMDLTAIEAGNFTLRRSPLDIGEVVTATIESCQPKAEEKGIQLSVNCQPGIEDNPVLADKDAMCSVFRNLIDNAIKYTQQKGHVHVGVEQNGIYVKVTVSDDGIGMTPEQKARVFEEFFRARNRSTAAIAGTGLGLSIVKRLVEMHHGKVTVRSAPGQGSTFTVSIPIA